MGPFDLHCMSFLTYIHFPEKKFPLKKLGLIAFLQAYWINAYG